MQLLPVATATNNGVLLAGMAPPQPSPQENTIAQGEGFPPIPHSQWLQERKSMTDIRVAILQGQAEFLSMYG